MKWIGSGTIHYQIGIYMGIAITIISLLGSANYPWFQSTFDWMFVFFIGLVIFFFFMAISLNSVENTNVKIDDLPEGRRNKNTFTLYETYLDRFNILSKSCFTISIIFGILAGFRLFAMMIKSI